MIHLSENHAGAVAHTLSLLSKEAVAQLDSILTNAADYYLMGDNKTYMAIAQEAFYQIAKKYGIAAQSLGLQMLEEMNVPAIDIVPAMSGENVRGIVQKGMNTGGRWGVSERSEAINRRAMNGMMDQAVKSHYRRTVMRNGDRFARVPTGAYTCPWCVMLASRGFVYRSEETAGSMGQFHAYCNCLVVSETNIEDYDIEGYDPGKLYDLYKEGKGLGERPSGHVALDVDGKVIKANELFRKTSNTGAFSHLPVTMQKREILRIAKEYGIDASKLKIVIDADVDKLGTGYTGWTDSSYPGRISLFPDAFISEEEIAKTLLHEKAHVGQLIKYGKKYVEDYHEEIEKVALRYENMWYNYLQRNKHVR